MTEVYRHPIELKETFFLRSNVVAVPNHVPPETTKQIQPSNNINVSEIENQPGQYFASMRTVINAEMDTSIPYFVDMECMAILTTDDTLKKDEALRGVMITAHSVLYGSIRESVAWLTSRQPYGPLLLGLSVLQPSTKMPEQQTQSAAAPAKSSTKK